MASSSSICQSVVRVIKRWVCIGIIGEYFSYLSVATIGVKYDDPIMDCNFVNNIGDRKLSCNRV